MDFLSNHIEALVFCSPKPITEGELQGCLVEMFDAEVPNTAIMAGLESIRQKFDTEVFSIELVKSGGGYQFLTKPAYQASIGTLLKRQSKKRLSGAAMETLSIIAYKQPITRSEAEQIRGVNCDYVIQKLLEKELIEIKGKSEGVGQPLLYGTGQDFMDYFGINDLKELPTPKDFNNTENTIGEEKNEAS